MARKKQIPVDGIYPALIPKTVEAKMSGDEPIHTNDRERGATLLRAFSWYNRHFTNSDAKEFISEYLRINNLPNLDKFMRVPEKRVCCTIGWVARCSMRGLILTEREKMQIAESVLESINAKHAPVEVQDSVPVTKVNVQEAMQNRAREAAGELEGMFDDFMASPKITASKTVDILTRFNVQPQFIPAITSIWERKQNELNQIVSDKDLQEGYSQFGKVELRHVAAYIEKVINDIRGYVNLKKVARKPRAKKAVPVEKIVAKLKFCKEYMDPVGFVLNSVSPTKLHGCSEAFLYDYKKKKLIYLVADEYSKTLSVKNNTIIGIDESKSFTRTVKKSLEVNRFMSLSRPMSRKFFNELTTVATKPSNRMSEQILILKTF